MSLTAQLIDGTDPLLRRAAVRLPILPPDLPARVAALRALMIDSHGVGIAAPQVGWPIALAIIAPPGEDERVLINPTITADTQELVAEWEGCLSLPGIEALIARPTRIAVRYTDAGGRTQHCELTGIAARIAAHEIDHLDGVLITDRAIEQRPREGSGV